MIEVAAENVKTLELCWVCLGLSWLILCGHLNALSRIHLLVYVLSLNLKHLRLGQMQSFNKALSSVPSSLLLFS